MKTVSVAKFGGGLLDSTGNTIPKVLERIKDLSNKTDLGPVVVFSAPSGYTDELIGTGESSPHSGQLSVDSIFASYERIAKRYVTGIHLKPLLSELKKYREQTYAGFALVNRRFQGNARAKVLTSGGELPTSVLMEYVLKANGFPSCSIPVEHWPIVTDDNFENATPLYDASKERISNIMEPLEGGEIVSQAGFLGVTMDGLETTLGRGGSDLTAVFISCLLKSRYHVETLLFKDLPVQSADPSVINAQNTQYVPVLTYNEAHKASLMGMKIVQGAAISMARRFKQPIKVVPIDEPEKLSVIKSESDTKETVKCVTGKTGCAILSIHDEKSRSLEDSLRIWENRHDFLDLGTETLETGERIRDFLFLDAEFLRKNEKKLKGFDDKLAIEFGVGVVTLVGDRMKHSPGVASIAVGAMPGINIKRGIFAPHTSQIILVVDEENVSAALTAIHNKRDEMNRSP